jgi:3',5'-cyclic AMP phosphodiesterase CpdA
MVLSQDGKRYGDERPFVKLAATGARREHQGVRILHFSDIHLGLGVRRVPLADWPGKRFAGGANLIRGRGRRFADAAEKTRRMVRLARELKADFVVCTGDLTALATEAEMLAAQMILQPLLETDRILVIPGNHDLYTWRDVRQRRFENRFRSSLRSDLPDLCTDGPWPIVRLPFPDTAIVAVNSARPNRAPWKSSGRVPDAQVSGLEMALADPRVAGRFVFLLTHYAPCRADGSPDSREHGLENVDQVVAAAGRIERGAWLCGHIHTTFWQELPGFSGDIFCAGSATLEGREGFWVFDSSEGEAEWSARRGRWVDSGYVVDPPMGADL